DLAALRPIPNLTIASPYDEHELRRLMYTAQLSDKGVFVIRYPRGAGRLTDWRCPLEEVPIGRGRKLKDGRDIAVISLGPLGNVVADAIAEAEKEHPELAVAHYDLRFLKPLDEDMLHEIGQNFHKVITVEDGVRLGGMGSAVLEFFADNGYHPIMKRLALPDKFVEHGRPDELYELVGLDRLSIRKAIED
ncbi:MAG: 1-deoxy-D-xylulose-5-phosphate synthase, partial [Bacteroidaceae bacterium]|nr:1-deoxy-D-xylulose-5-phosphate synthase [Bacteroidaceae bacterium]